MGKLTPLGTDLRFLQGNAPLIQTDGMRAEEIASVNDMRRMRKSLHEPDKTFSSLV